MEINKSRVAQAFRITSSFVRYRIRCPRPFFVSYQITFRCNRRCVFCNAWRRKTYAELDTRESKKVIDELADFGVSVLGITGGEPLVRKDLEEIAAYAKGKGMVVGINTNGTLLTPERAKSIASVFDTVFVSLDGFEKTHDEIRGEKGTFQEAYRGLKNLIAVKKKCTVGVNFVLNNMNYEEFIPFCRWIKDLGVLVTFFPVGGDENVISAFSVPRCKVDGFVLEVLREKTLNPFIGPSEKVIGLVPDFVKGEMPRICDAGRLYFGVSPTGELRICPIGPDSPNWKVGSLSTSSMKELVNSPRFRQVLEARKHCASCLAGCTTPYSLLFNGSAGDLTREALGYLKCIWNVGRKPVEVKV